MYLLLILFFASLIGIVLMVGKKLALLKSGHIEERSGTPFGAQYLEELKQTTLRNIKKHGYAGLVATIRLYVQSSNFTKAKLDELTLRLKNMRRKGAVETEAEKQEVNNFLQMVSEYKRKIREIKHKITKEEENKQ